MTLWQTLVRLILGRPERSFHDDEHTEWLKHQQQASVEAMEADRRRYDDEFFPRRKEPFRAK